MEKKSLGGIYGSDTTAWLDSQGPKLAEFIHRKQTSRVARFFVVPTYIHTYIKTKREIPVCIYQNDNINTKLQYINQSGYKNTK
jgi:hypothetical protein